MRLAIDTGGTFTDVVVRHADGLLTLHKAPSTPHDPIEGILAAIGRAAAAEGLQAATRRAVATRSSTARRARPTRS